MSSKLIKLAVANAPLNDEYAARIAEQAPVVRTVEELEATEGIRFETGRATENKNADPETNGRKEFYRVPMIYNDQRGRAIVVAAMFAIYSANTSVVEEELILRNWSLFGFLPIRGRVHSMLEFMNTYGPDYEYIDNILNNAPGPENYLHRLRSVAVLRGLAAKTASFFLGMLGDTDSPTVDMHGIKRIMDQRYNTGFDDELVKFPEMKLWTTAEMFAKMEAEAKEMAETLRQMKPQLAKGTTDMFDGDIKAEFRKLTKKYQKLKADIAKRRVHNKDVIQKTFSRFAFSPEYPNRVKGLMEYIKWQQYGFEGKTDNQWVAYDDMFSKERTKEYQDFADSEDYTLHRPVYEEMFGKDFPLDTGEGSIIKNLNRMRSRMKDYSDEFNRKRIERRQRPGTERTPTEWDFEDSFDNKQEQEIHQYAMSDSVRRQVKAYKPTNKDKKINQFVVEDWSTEQAITFPESVTTRYRSEDADPLSDYYDGNEIAEDFALESGPRPTPRAEEAYYDELEDPGKEVEEEHSTYNLLRSLTAQALMPTQAPMGQAGPGPAGPPAGNGGGNGGGNSLDNAIGFSDYEWQFTIPLNTENNDIELYKSNKNNKWMYITPDGEEHFADTSLRRTLKRIQEKYDIDMAGYIGTINDNMPRFGQ